jgi:hypothetical protein
MTRRSDTLPASAYDLRRDVAFAPLKERPGVFRFRMGVMRLGWLLTSRNSPYSVLHAE